METSAYSSEMVVARILTKLTMKMCYNLKIIGVAVYGQSHMMRYKNSVINKCTIPYIICNKNHNDI